VRERILPPGEAMRGLRLEAAVSMTPLTQIFCCATFLNDVV
jgi:hypothetical protein